ncbi:hypothetical protein ETAA8_18160 [Anatilimnocola aggregata]|uniref:Uncharacterized protein n=1 Tax=Anatilimnocola aggregata TaxID=2528021 RepID=A0A517Y941_9BACT|nr:hypothetical protein ETAA8_18160 [Anatilimnocola aggregata]
MTIQLRHGKTPQNLKDGPIPPNTVLHRVLTLIATAVATQIRDRKLDNARAVETNEQVQTEPLSLREGD